jgi:hypothetical protein
VGRIDLHERDFCFRGLVLAILAELGERHVCSVSSRRLRQQFAASIGRAFLVTVILCRVLRRRPLSTIKDYIEHQKRPG